MLKPQTVKVGVANARESNTFEVDLDPSKYADNLHNILLSRYQCFF